MILKKIEQEEDFYKVVRVSNFWNNNHIEHESDGDRRKNMNI